jgi:hypothetical protein
MKKLIFLLIFLFAINASFAQSEDEKAIKSVVMQLFEGIQKHDSTLLKNTFHSSARIQTIGVNRKTGLNVLTTENEIDNFIKQICHNSINISLREVPKSFEIRIDNQLATVWTPYEFYVNEQISHCGVDSFQLFKTIEGWKILSLIYSIHKCE